MIEPGDVIAAFVPGAHEGKRRPCVVISTQNYLSQRPDVTFAIITTQVEKATTEFDCVLFDWRDAGLQFPSAVRSYFYTTKQSEVHKIGRLSAADWQEVQIHLRLALEL